MTHRFALQVYYEDTDMGGIVYHANYLKFIERARSDWVRSIGVDQNAMRRGGVVFVVRHMECDFRAPAYFEDRLSVETRPVQQTGVRSVLEQKVLRDDDLLFVAKVTIVSMGADGRPRRLPAEFRAS